MNIEVVSKICEMNAFSCHSLCIIRKCMVTISGVAKYFKVKFLMCEKYTMHKPFMHLITG